VNQPTSALSVTAVSRMGRLLAAGALGLWLLATGLRPGPAAASPTDAITLTAPNNTTVAESDDYATQVLGNPWDMNGPEDTDYLDHMTPPTISNGIWSSQTTADYGSIYLKSQGWPTSMEYLGEPSGAVYPIDSRRFTHLRLRMYSSVADQIVVWWFTRHNFTPSGNSQFVPTQAGWHVYDIDLTAGSNWLSAATWSGLRLDPVFHLGHSNVTIQLDWARLTPATGSSVSVQWTATGTSPVSLYVTTGPNGPDEMRIASGLAASSGGYTWSTAGIAPGTYYIHAVMGTASSYSGPLIVNNAPVLTLTAPSPSSGEDFASTHLAQPWTLTNISQLQAWFNIANISFGPSYMQASATNGDPQLWPLNMDTAHAVDTSKYHYFSYNIYIPRPAGAFANGQYSQWNGGPRAIWSQGNQPLNWQQTKVVIGWYNRWLHVAQDLRNTQNLETGSTLGWVGTPAIFRFDPHESDNLGTNILPPFFQAGQLRLTADPTVASGGATTITWVPGKATGNVTLYYNTSQAPGGTAIATVPLSSGGYVWTVNLPGGQYWISAVANDGLNTFTQLALVPLTVAGSRPCPATFSDVPASAPFYLYISSLFCRNIVDGYSDNTFHPNDNALRGLLAQWVVRARGWALDTTGAPHFSDVATTDPLYPYIETAYGHGVLSGYSDGTFRPYTQVTRGQMSKMIVNALGWTIDTTGGPHFSDVPTSNAFYAQIETLYNHGAVSGYGDGTFRWGAPLTRGQLSKVLYNAVGP